jgi:hypothetical protein
MCPIEYNYSNSIFNNVDEDEYASSRCYREQDPVRTCAYIDAEWTSELQSERFTQVA